MPKFASLEQKNQILAKILKTSPYLANKPIIEALLKKIRSKNLPLEEIFTYEISGRKFKTFYVQKFSLLLYASLCGDLELLKIAIECNTPLDSNFGKTKTTILHWLANRGHLEAAEFLLKQNRNLLNLTNFIKDTPLHWAAMMGQTKVVELFVKFSTNINCPNFSGKTPYDLAMNNDHFATANLLRFELVKEFLAKKMSNFINSAKSLKLRHLTNYVNRHLSAYDFELIDSNQKETVQIIEETQDLTINIVMQILQNQYLVAHLFNSLKINNKKNIATKICDKFCDKSEAKIIEDEEHLALKVLYKQIRQVMDHAPYDRILRKFEQEYEYEPVNKDLTWKNPFAKFFKDIYKNKDMRLDEFKATIEKICYEENGEIKRVTALNMKKMLTIALYRPDLMIANMENDGLIEKSTSEGRHEKFLKIKENFTNLMMRQLCLNETKGRAI